MSFDRLAVALSGGVDSAVLLAEAQAVLAVQIAKSQQLLKGGTENYLVTREFNKISDREQKEKLLHCLFEISAADESISLIQRAACFPLLVRIESECPMLWVLVC